MRRVGGTQRGEQAIRETRVVGFFFMVVMLVEVDQGRRTTAGAGTVSLGFADNFEKRHGHQPPGTRDEGITGFVPVAVVLPADDVKEVSLAESEFLGIGVVGLVVVEGFDDLRNW